jgi:hypothetical protein
MQNPLTANHYQLTYSQDSRHTRKAKILKNVTMATAITMQTFILSHKDQNPLTVNYYQPTKLPDTTAYPRLQVGRTI